MGSRVSTFRTPEDSKALFEMHQRMLREAVCNGEYREHSWRSIFHPSSANPYGDGHEEERCERCYVLSCEVDNE